MTGKAALVLAGGGAYGAYQLGCLRALLGGQSPATRFAPVNPEIVAGTSAGALNSALLLSPGEDELLHALEYVEDVWVNQLADTRDSCGGNLLRIRANPLDFFNPACLEEPLRLAWELAGDAATVGGEWIRRGVNFFRSEGALEQRVIELFDIETLISTQPAVELVRRTVRLAPIRDSSRVLRIAATNWKTGKLRIFANGEMTDQNGHDIVLASSAIPGVFPTVEIEGQPYADGGLVMNTPLKPAIEAGASVIHLVYMDPDAINLPLPKTRNTAATLYRFSIIALAAMLDRDLTTAHQVNLGLQAADPEQPQAPEKSALFTRGKRRLRELSSQAADYRPLTIHRYHPYGSPGLGIFGWLTFGIDQIRSLIELGYRDTVFHDCKRNRCVVPDSGAA